MTMTYTPETMASMKELFEGPMPPYERAQLVEQLQREAENAGVGDVAHDLGLTFKQWQLVRDPIRTLRAAVIAAGGG